MKARHWFVVLASALFVVSNASADIFGDVAKAVDKERKKVIPDPPPIVLPPVLPQVQKTVEDAAKKGLREAGNAGKQVVEQAARAPGDIINAGKTVVETIPPKVTKSLESVAKGTIVSAYGVTKSSILPMEAQLEGAQVVMGKKSGSEAWNKITASARESAAITGVGVQVASQGAAEVQAVADATVEDMTGAALGETGRDLARAYLAPKRYLEASGLTAAQYAALVAQGKDPAMLLAAPLAIALNEAYSTYKPNSKPVPPAIGKALAKLYTPEYLANVTWQVGNVKNLTLPDGLGGANKVFGNDLAVTVNDVIIFSREPTAGDLWWWAHELAHVGQYAELGGIESFAWAYVKHYQDLENQADATANLLYVVPKGVAPSDTIITAQVNPALERLSDRLSIEAGWVVARCENAAAPAEGEPPAQQVLRIGVKNMVRPEEGPCAVGSLEVPSGGLKELLHYSRFDAPSCTNTLERYVLNLRAEGWKCTKELPAE